MISQKLSARCAAFFPHLPEAQAGRPHPTLCSLVANLLALSFAPRTCSVCAKALPPILFLISSSFFLTHMVVQGRPHSTLSLQTLPARQNFPFCLCSYHTEKCIASQASSFLRFGQGTCSPSSQGNGRASPVLWYLWHMLLSETVVSSWKSSRAPLGQVRVPVAFLEHSKPETPIPLTHVSNLGDYSTDTRKTASNIPGASLQSCNEVSLLNVHFRGA